MKAQGHESLCKRTSFRTVWIGLWILMISLLLGCGQQPEAGKASITIPINLSPMQANRTTFLNIKMGIRIFVEGAPFPVIEEPPFPVSLDDFRGEGMKKNYQVPVEELLMIDIVIFGEDGNPLLVGMEEIYIEEGNTYEEVDIHMEPVNGFPY